MESGGRALEKSTNVKAVRAGFGYTIGNILSKGLSFLTMPLFGRLLSVEDYGRYNVYTAYTSVLFVVAGLAVHVSIKNANIDYKEKLKEYNSSLSLIIVLNSLLLWVFAFLFGKPMTEAGIIEFDWFFILVVFESFCMAMITFYNHVLSVSYLHKEYVITSLIYAALGIILSVVFIETVFSDERFLGRVFGMLVAGAIFVIFIGVRLYKSARPRVNKEFWKYGLKISLPVVPHGISQMVLSMSDRLMIKHYYGDREAGIYGFANNLGTILQVITTAMDTAWSQWFFDKLSSGDKQSIRKAGSIYAFLVSGGVILLMSIAPETIVFMGGEKYREGCILTFPILVAVYFSFMYFFPSAIEFYHKKTMLIAIGTVSVAALNVVLNLWFIPKAGYEAAAYTTRACYVIYYFIHVIFAYHVQKEFLFNMKIHITCVTVVSLFGTLFVLTQGVWFVRFPILILGIAIGIVIGIKNKEVIRKLIKK